MRALILVLFTLLMCSCDCKKSAGSDPQPQPVTPGALKLVVAPTSQVRSFKAAKAANVAVPRAVGADFVVGDIKSTTTYLFLLKNSGGSSVSNITLSSTNPAVEVVPSTIGVLEPDSVGGLSPIIQVTIKHGSGAGHFGSAPLIAAGDLEFSIGAAGTNSQGATSVTASIGGTVRVADFTLSNNGQDMPTISEGTVGQRSTVDGQLPYVTKSTWSDTTIAAVDPTDSLWSITNTGNAPLTVTSYRSLEDATFDEGGSPISSVLLPTCTVISSMVVAPGATVSINSQMRNRAEAASRMLGDGTWVSGHSWRFETFVRVSSGGVVIDPTVQLATEDDTCGFYLQESVFVDTVSG